MLLWQGYGLIVLLGYCEKCYYDTEKFYYDNVIITQQFISTYLLWQKITENQNICIMWLTINCLIILCACTMYFHLERNMPCWHRDSQIELMSSIATWWHNTACSFLKLQDVWHIAYVWKNPNKFKNVYPSSFTQNPI